MILVDTNLLVYAHRGGCAEHSAACAAIERAARAPGGWAIALPALAESWMVLTRPSSAGGPSTPEQAGSYLAALIETGRPSILGAEASVGRRLVRLAVDPGLSGPRILDLQIGLIALEGGADVIWTHDAGFVPAPGLRVEDPLSA